ncbi:hypothetical protein ABZV60_34970 [Streptomyces sp. NPDC004787]|uniref:hypothetical protein n=1 Tax=Streptomyces sp. NPDC004787 TaxID=3154291 RepID=UPI0033B47AC7
MSLARLRSSAASLALTTAVIAGFAAGTAHAAEPTSQTSLSQVSPFTEPGFSTTCSWHQFGEGEKPPWWLLMTDPLCVEYAKRDITVDNGGALRFLVAEPSRFAIAMLTCHYYQKDHWSIQATTGATPWVTWDGQYWWDKSAQRAGARLTNFRINGQSAGVGDVVAVLETSHPDIAEVLRDYGKSAGETGLTVDLPYDLRCSLTG